MRVDIALIDIKRVTEYVQVQCPDDAELLAGMLEGETDLYELVEKLVTGIEEESGFQDVLAEQVKNRQSRKAASAKREKALRGAALQLMDAGRQKKIVLPQATLSKSVRKPKRIVTDVHALPDNFKLREIVVSADMKKVKDAETDIPGTTMDNGSTSLTVRMK